MEEELGTSDRKIDTEFDPKKEMADVAKNTAIRAVKKYQVANTSNGSGSSSKE